GLARAGPGHDEQRAALVQDGGALLRVQVLEEGIAGGDGHVPSVGGDADAWRPPRGPVRSPCRPRAGRDGSPSQEGGGPAGRCRRARWSPPRAPPLSPPAGLPVGPPGPLAATAPVLPAHTGLAPKPAIRHHFPTSFP